MTVAEAPARRPRRCVRCGHTERFEDTYLCFGCLPQRNAETRSEMAAALDMAPNGPRFVLLQSGWAGGWPSMREPA